MICGLLRNFFFTDDTSIFSVLHDVDTSNRGLSDGLKKT